MIRAKLLFIVVSVVFLLWVSVVAVLAQGEQSAEIPPPYKGLENPFSWNNAAEQERGKEIYQRSCIGCHGATGSGIAKSDFSTVDYPRSLEERPDFFFWILSEGELDKGMPPYKASLSEEQRWQVLTYLWSLGKVTPGEVTPLDEIPTEVGDFTLLLTTPEKHQSGQPLTLSALLQDGQDKPVPNARVKFFIRANFFTSGLMEIGDVLTDDQGIAVFEFIPRQTGDTEVVARYQTMETATIVNLAETDKPFYNTEVGLQSWTLGKESFISFPAPNEHEEESAAPKTVLRLPTGVLFWGTPLLLIVISIWVTCFYVVYQVYRIPIIQEIRDTNTRLIPTVVLAIVIALGTLLSLMLITGPYSR